MDLQYVYDDSTSPPTPSVLQYKVDPDTVFVSTDEQQMYADLTVTIFNPTQQAVTCQAFQLGFYVGALYGDLTAQATGIQTSSDQTSWTISSQASENPDYPNLYQFSAPAAGAANFKLAPQQSLVFHLKGVLINQAVGEGGAPLVITEVTGTDLNNPTIVQGQIVISKQQPTLSINSFSAAPPPPINRGDQVTLNWQITSAGYWLLYDDSGNLLYDSRSGKPLNASSYGPLAPQVNTTYELQAWAGQLYTTQPIEVIVRAAQFVTSPSGSPTVVDSGGAVVLSWQTRDASQLVISASDPNFKKVTLNAPAGQFDHFPDAPNNQWTVNPTLSTTYTLDIYGPGNSHAQGQVQISVNPPQIVCLSADHMTFSPNQPVHLSWQSKSGQSAKLEQSIAGTSGVITVGINLPTNTDAYPVSPTGISTYYLTVQGQGQAIRQLSVFEALGTIATLTMWEINWTPTAMAFDGTNIWTGAYNRGTAFFKSRASDGQTNGYGFDWRILAIAFVEPYLWVASNSDNIIKWKVTDGSTQQQPIAGGYEPLTLFFDGTDMWIEATIGNASYLVKMRVSDGQVLAAMSLPGALTGVMSFDGAYIWSSFQDPRCLVKLRTSDGGVVQTIPLTYYDFPTGMTFDGANIWVSIANGTEGHYILVIPTGNNAGTPQKIPVPVAPWAVCFDGTYVWVANDDSTLSRF